MVNFQEAFSWLKTSLTFGIKPGLERVEWLLAELGHPEQELSAVHVVGTNGKGSTVNYLRHVFEAAGYEVGTFTSPSIMDFRERIAVNGQMISKEDFSQAVSILRPVVERLERETDFGPATEFELITLMMFLYFGRLRPVDLVVIEAGLGGRYDSTNVFTPLAVVCTSIGLDHQNFLGDSHLAIAKEKIGVLKPGVPLVFACDRTEVVSHFRAVAKNLSSPVYALGQEFEMVRAQDGLTFSSGQTVLSGLSLAMPGRHQEANAGLAVMTALLLQMAYPALTEEHIRSGLKASYWLGRTELVKPNLMLDGAHNDESVTALVEVLTSHYGDKTIHILFGAIDTKPVTSMLDQLRPVGQVSVTHFDYPNAYDLAAYPEDLPRVSSFEEWLTQADQAGPDDLFVVTGSLYFIGQVRRHLLGHSGA